jgi:HTH-type transcriptional regulator/antitoxin HigA
MHAFPIRNDADLDRAIALIDDLWDAAPGSTEADLCEVMAQLVEAYEARELSQVLPPPNPRLVIDAKRKELQWSQRELGRRLGWGSGRVSEILSGKRDLTLAMIRDLERVLGIPPGLLVAGHTPRSGEGTWVRLPDDLVQKAQQCDFAGCDGLDTMVAVAVGQLSTIAELTITTAASAVVQPTSSKPTSDGTRLSLVFSREAA